MITIRCPECGALEYKHSSLSLLECPRCGCDLGGEDYSGRDQIGDYE